MCVEGGLVHDAIRTDVWCHGRRNQHEITAGASHGSVGKTCWYNGGRAPPVVLRSNVHPGLSSQEEGKCRNIRHVSVDVTDNGHPANSLHGRLDDDRDNEFGRPLGRRCTGVATLPAINAKDGERPGRPDMTPEALGPTQGDRLTERVRKRGDPDDAGPERGAEPNSGVRVSSRLGVRGSQVERK